MHITGQSVNEMAGTLPHREQTLRSFAEHLIYEKKTPVTAVQAATELLENCFELSDAEWILVGQIRVADK